MSSKRWIKQIFCLIIVNLVVFALIIIAIDPAMHYHKPLSFISYEMNHERYDNDGMMRNLEYSAIITGTSMTENFKVSEFNETFKTSAIKTPFMGAGYLEIKKNLERAFEYNENIQIVLWGLDFDLLLRGWDWSDYSDYPEYLYDNNYFNDVSYVLNKDIFFSQVIPDILRTLQGKESQTLDDYATWQFPTGKENVLERYSRLVTTVESQAFTEADRISVVKTIQENILNITKKHPNTTFYLFFTPYSIVAWDAYNQEGNIERQIESERIALEMLVQEDNIQIYCFFNNPNLITNLNNYKDPYHYDAEINSQIINWIKDEKYRITKDNYLEHIEQEKNFYITYDYNKFFER